MGKIMSVVLCFLFSFSTTVHAQKDKTVTVEVLTVEEQTVKRSSGIDSAHSEAYEQSFRIVGAKFKLPDGKVVTAACFERPKQYSSHEPFMRPCPQLAKGTYQAKVYKTEIWLYVTSEKKSGKTVTHEFVFDVQ